jgi:lipopolysaccharide transport system permease protein
MMQAGAHSASPVALLRSLFANRTLIKRLIWREVSAKYKGSLIGIGWALLNPMLMLAVYTFVFSIVFKARWPGGAESKTEFALVLFAGLLAFTLFSECLTRAPHLIVGNVSYVTKVVFPLEILPVVSLGVAFFNWTVGFVIWVGFHLVFRGIPPLTILITPFALMPLMAIGLGVGWLFASLGTFIRDISQIVGVGVSVLMFLSPIFYPVAALPKDYQFLMTFNPLTIPIEQIRSVMMWGVIDDVHVFAAYCAVASLFMALTFAWFQKTRHGFSDVL